MSVAVETVDDPIKAFSAYGFEHALPFMVGADHVKDDGFIMLLGYFELPRKDGFLDHSLFVFLGLPVVQSDFTNAIAVC